MVSKVYVNLLQLSYHMQVLFISNDFLAVIFSQQIYFLRQAITCT